MVDFVPGHTEFAVSNPVGSAFAPELDEILGKGAAMHWTTLSMDTGVGQSSHGRAFNLSGWMLQTDPAATMGTGWYCVARGPGTIDPNDGNNVILADGEWALIGTNGTSTFIMKGGISPRMIVKSADETISSDPVNSDDAVLKFNVLANTKYWFRGRIWFNSDAVADFKFDFGGPASPTRFRVRAKHLDGEADVTETILAAITAFASGAGIGCDGTDGYLEFEGFLHNGANAGTLSFRWSQNTSNASNTTVYAGSTLEYGIAQ